MLGHRTEWLCVSLCLAGMLATAKDVAGGPPGQAMPTPPSQGFLNFQSLGFLNPPAPTSAYGAGRGGQPCVIGGVSAPRGFSSASTHSPIRRGYGAGAYPNGLGFGAVGAPYFYVTPGDYGSAIEYTSAAPLEWNQPGEPAVTPPAVWVPPPRGDAAEITVRVPPDAEVWIEGVKMRQQGSIRRFVSPRLASGKTYSYEIRAVWTEKDRPIDQKQEISLRAGDRSSLTFVSGAGRSVEVVPTPGP